jgi:hypothetical protein
MLRTTGFGSPLLRRRARRRVARQAAFSSWITLARLAATIGVVGLVLVNVILLSRMTGEDRSPVALAQAGVDQRDGGRKALTDRGKLDALNVTEIGVPLLHSAGRVEAQLRETNSDLSAMGTPLESVMSDSITDSNSGNSGSNKDASQGDDPVEGEDSVESEDSEEGEDPEAEGNTLEDDEHGNPHEDDEQGNPHEGDEEGDP